MVGMAQDTHSETEKVIGRFSYPRYTFQGTEALGLRQHMASGIAFISHLATMKTARLRRSLLRSYMAKWSIVFFQVMNSGRSSKAIDTMENDSHGHRALWLEP